MLFGGSLGDGADVSLNIRDPFSGVILSLSVNLGVLGTSLLTDLFLSGLSSFFIDASSCLPNESSVGVDFIQSLGVIKRIVLLGMVSGAVRFLLSDGTLNLIGVDNSGDIGVSHLMDGESPSFLLLTGLSVGTEDVVKFLESTFGPDDESSYVTSRSQLKEVKSADVCDLNSRNISESLDEGNISATVDNQWSSSGSVSSVS